MHPGHQKESWGPGGVKSVLCTPCAFGMRMGEMAGGWAAPPCASCTQGYLAAGSSQPTAAKHGCWQIWYHKAALKTKRHFYASPWSCQQPWAWHRFVQKESRDIRKHLYRAVLSRTGEGVCLQWEHHIDVRGRDGKGRVKLLQTLVQSNCANLQGCHTYPLPSNMLGTKYLMPWEQDEESCPYPM